MDRPIVALLGAGLLAPAVALAEDVPDAFAVEWQGQHPCEKLYEDAQIRIGRCTFPPGAVHLRHAHPGYFTYTLSGGKGQVQDAAGTRKTEARADASGNSPPIPWHEFSNTGDTTIRYLVVERKYEPAPGADQAAAK